MALRSTAIVLATSVSISPVSPASAYPIDCAILLCLAGGWPSSAECTAARAEFIRRITPWPIEPPLQIWRCPMGASLNTQSLTERLWSISTTALPLQSLSANDGYYRLIEAQAMRPRAVDLSSSDFDFIRSITVYDVDWYAWAGTTSDGDRDVCHIPKARSRLGTYGLQGEFAWDGFNITTAPNWLKTNLHVDEPCAAAGRFRGVGVEWTDYFGNHGYEVIRY